ncbi:glycosyltransferase family 4 protein [Steroidobacter sp.]|uniref:glycosyltransferase family 4 protein n=1 Tax=Steroidobacter sp. TaxID=1978227 RepID=UPI001A58D40C|nr:glycosyltransferase family 4 protein [Steroidobacter sp.]MBL8267300.1 glycosyltransferase family 4 protein [Steroidobacter sp.]
MSAEVQDRSVQGEQTSATLSGASIAVVSRCARTLFNFRRSLIGEAQRAGAQVVAYGSAGEGFEQRLQAAGIRFEHIPVSWRGLDPLADLTLLWTMVRMFRRSQPHVVHSFTIKPAIYGTVAAWLAKVPVRIVTITGLGHAFTTAGPLVRGVVTRLYRFALARAQIVFFQNPDDRDLFLRLRLVAPAVARLIPGSGVDLQRFAPAPLPSEARASPHFLMIARLLREKGVREFVEAAAIVKQRHPGAVFTLLGGVDSRNPSALSTQELAKLRGSAAVQWVDEVLDVRPHIAAADVMVLPSYREGLPRTLLEGAAMGRALVATDAPGCRELVIPGTTGYLVPVRDSVALARAMQHLCEHPGEISAMGQAARQMVEATYDQRVVDSICIQAYAEQRRKVR